MLMVTLDSYMLEVHMDLMVFEEDGQHYLICSQWIESLHRS